MEIGPYRVKDGSKPQLEYNTGSWSEFANIMFVDNPVGTGYSFVDGDSYVKELPDMADQFVQFLEKWFALFPEYEHDDVSGPLMDLNDHLCGIFSLSMLTLSSSTLLGNPMPDSIFHISPKRFLNATNQLNISGN